MSRTVLITGATGFVGRHLLDLIAPEPVAIVGWRRANAGEALPERYPEHGRVTWRDVDVASPESVLDAVLEARPDEVYHLAAQSHVAVTFDEPEYTGDVTPAWARRGCSRLFASPASARGSTKRPPPRCSAPRLPRRAS